MIIKLYLKLEAYVRMVLNLLSISASISSEVLSSCDTLFGVKNPICFPSNSIALRRAGVLTTPSLLEKDNINYTIKSYRLGDGLASKTLRY